MGISVVLKHDYSWNCHALEFLNKCEGVYVYCNSGEKARAFAELLEEDGFSIPSGIDYDCDEMMFYVFSRYQDGGDWVFEKGAYPAPMLSNWGLYSRVISVGDCIVGFYA